ncbi:hypothetical protein A2U01_0049313 [Trifolium medium]|uniref:Uncharacterized protein n=1 Tax=Trifolium medium TaxID=97028 RepID=A0A392QUR8_9FABA|nr:hypothetical protein [Trifolium medium]
MKRHPNFHLPPSVLLIAVTVATVAAASHRSSQRQHTSREI